MTRLQTLAVIFAAWLIVSALLLLRAVLRRARRWRRRWRRFLSLALAVARLLGYAALAFCVFWPSVAVAQSIPTPTAMPVPTPRPLPTAMPTLPPPPTPRPLPTLMPSLTPIAGGGVVSPTLMPIPTLMPTPSVTLTADLSPTFSVAWDGCQIREIIEGVSHRDFDGPVGEWSSCFQFSPVGGDLDAEYCRMGFCERSGSFFDTGLGLMVFSDTLASMIGGDLRSTSVEKIGGSDICGDDRVNDAVDSPALVLDPARTYTYTVSITVTVDPVFCDGDVIPSLCCTTVPRAGLHTRVHRVADDRWLTDFQVNSEPPGSSFGPFVVSGMDSIYVDLAWYSSVLGRARVVLTVWSDAGSPAPVEYGDVVSQADHSLCVENVTADQVAEGWTVWAHVAHEIDSEAFGLWKTDQGVDWVPSFSWVDVHILESDDDCFSLLQLVYPGGAVEVFDCSGAGVNACRYYSLDSGGTFDRHALAWALCPAGVDPDVDGGECEFSDPTAQPGVGGSGLDLCDDLDAFCTADGAPVCVEFPAVPVPLINFPGLRLCFVPVVVTQLMIPGTNYSLLPWLSSLVAAMLGLIVVQLGRNLYS